MMINIQWVELPLAILGAFVLLAIFMVAINKS